MTVLDFKRQFAKADCRKIDVQVRRETSGKGKTDPRWAQAKRHIPSIDTIRREDTPQVGHAVPPPKGIKSYIAWLKEGRAAKPSEGDVAFCNPLMLAAQRRAIRLAPKQANKLFPGYGKNPLAGQPLEMGDPGHGKATPTLKHPTPMAHGLFLTGNGRALRPPMRWAR